MVEEEQRRRESNHRRPARGAREEWLMNDLVLRNGPIRLGYYRFGGHPVYGRLLPASIALWSGPLSRPPHRRPHA